ncbi:MAG: bifunctional (p)ppGpp synthetase/guanosine-3',5'-bis(diphosphate) 3'-pyrophosphohydrolase [Deltaproteobacteria bacterium]|nr:bifunctional (p)ppGpp synthetase/guanosine-3',5'-bis(diphosphate) 3'-pyrophosphohydrolase [Deltaproteobacteria bacterium]
MITIDEIIDEIKKYREDIDEKKIREAFEFSSRAHEGQKRKSGEPYLTHPLDVGKILAQLKMDANSIIAAILHDTIEDTPVTKDDIRKTFGDEVADIVDGVTKISQIKFSKQEDRQAEYYRKMIMAMSKDIRVIMVKLADRLNNMRTLQFMSEAKQVSISQETLDIYAPIAGRMGIYWIKEDLEEYSFKFLKPTLYKQISVRTQRLYKKHETYMKKVIEVLGKQVGQTIKDFNISCRVKKPYSVYRKMKKQEISLDDVHDLLAFRVLVPTIEHCYEILGHIHALWRPIQGRFKDYIAMPKPNNYKSLHTTVVCFEAERVEFQLRTFDMHEIAEKGIAAHWKYKTDGRLDTRDEEKIAWLKQLVNWQTELKDSVDFVNAVKLDLFEEEIFVFTPKGDLKNLSIGSTPVDFAYAIHSAVGNACAGARVNGRMVTLNHKLESGDTVEIISNKNRVPSKDWLDFVVTSKAKTHIRQFMRKEQREKSIQIGRNIFETACRKEKAAPAKVVKTLEFSAFLKEKNIASIEDFYTAIVYGKYSPKQVLNIVYPHVSEKDETEKSEQGLGLEGENVIRKMFQKVTAKNKNLILVDQQDGMLVTFGKCCNPVNGDSIQGYVTRGRGVAVHRSECARMLSVDPDRKVQVAWNKNTSQDSLARVLIITEDRTGILAEITRVISERNVNISKVMVKSQQDGIARLSFDLNIRDIEALRKVMAAIENIKHVLNVVRQ